MKRALQHSKLEVVRAGHGPRLLSLSHEIIFSSSSLSLRQYVSDGISSVRPIVFYFWIQGCV